MPATITKLPDYLTTTLATFERNKYDSVGLTQLYPDYEVIKQQIQGRRIVRRTSAEYETFLEIDAPTSAERSYPNHPLQTAVHKLHKKVKSTMSKIRTKATFSEEEEALKGSSAEKLLDEIQTRMLKMDRDYWELLEHQFLSFEDDSSALPALRGVDYWVQGNSNVSGFDPNGGDDPETDGAGGITKASEPRWPNAVGTFDRISQDSFWDVIQKFLNRVKTNHLIPHPAFTSEMPNRVIYTQEPIQRAIDRYLSASNENHGMDGGAYRGSPVYQGLPITIWHAMSSPDSPVRPETGTVKLIDWETFHYIVHSAYDRKTHGPQLLPNIPGQFVTAVETYHLLHCARRDRNMILTTDNVDLQPDSV